MGIRDWLYKQRKDKEEAQPEPSPPGVKREDHLMQTISRPNGTIMRTGPKLILNDAVYYDEDIRQMSINRLRILFGDLADVLEEVKAKVTSCANKDTTDQEWLRRAEFKIKILSKYERMITNLMFDKKGVKVTQLKDKNRSIEPTLSPEEQEYIDQGLIEEEVVEEDSEPGKGGVEEVTTEKSASTRSLNDVFREVAQEELEPEDYFLVLGMAKERFKAEGGAHS